MCGRYTVTRPGDIAEAFEASLDAAVAGDEWWKPRFNVAPTQRAPVIVWREAGRAVEMMRWGLLPFWSGKPGAKPPLMINARVETVDAKPAFRDALARKRCLVAADGFFEWKRAGKTSQPFYFHPATGEFVAFAGLWARAKTDAGELHSFAIVTGPAGALVHPIHDRMPLALPRAAWDRWLDPALSAAEAHALLAAPDIAGWRADAVSPWVNHASHDDPSCIRDEPGSGPQLQLVPRPD